jgi:hypothetical protein
MCGRIVDPAADIGRRAAFFRLEALHDVAVAHQLQVIDRCR